MGLFGEKEEKGNNSSIFATRRNTLEKLSQLSKTKSYIDSIGKCPLIVRTFFDLLFNKTIQLQDVKHANTQHKLTKFNSNKFITSQIHTFKNKKMREEKLHTK